jgi:AcrR family transcriptional regulator
MRPIKQERAVRTRVEILEAAIKLFAHRGYMATSMAELAREIRMTPGALYWHFPTKEDLLLAAIDELRERFVREFAALIDGGGVLSARDRLIEYLVRTQAFLRYHREYSIFFGMAAAESANQNERVAQALRHALSVCVGLVAAIILDGQTRTGEFRSDLDPSALAHAVIAAHQGIVLHQRLYGTEVDYDALVKTMNAGVMDGILSRH